MQYKYWDRSRQEPHCLMISGDAGGKQNNAYSGECDIFTTEAMQDK